MLAPTTGPGVELSRKKKDKNKKDLEEAGPSEYTFNLDAEIDDDFDTIPNGGDAFTSVFDDMNDGDMDMNDTDEGILSHTIALRAY